MIIVGYHMVYISGCYEAALVLGLTHMAITV